MCRILVVHSGIGARTLCKIVLSRMGYGTDSEIVATHAEAMSIVTRYRPDLVILELIDESVFDLVRDLRTLHPDLPILIKGANETQQQSALDMGLRCVHLKYSMEFPATVRSILNS